ncbi:MAG: UDP-2,4-diacetamido-2,4,6-trideoxy-beta-L-altropyranose hydrolase, partial [Alphaproteobacteria bacterium]
MVFAGESINLDQDIMKKLLKIIFRADASNDIGSGHVMRCLSLADIFKRNKHETLFLCRQHKGHLMGLIAEKGHGVIALPPPKNTNDYHDGTDDYGLWLGASQAEDAACCINHIRLMESDWVVVDHYGIDHQWQRAIKPFTQHMMVIDDLANRNHHCDILLDQNLVKNYKIRYQGLIPQAAHALLG